jgi:acetyl-CoA acetyltransferase
MIAGGVESMSRAPFVMPKAESGLQPRQRRLRHHHRLALRQPADEGAYGVDSMPETAENVAAEYGIEREAQDRMALASQTKALAAQRAGFFDGEIVPVTIPQKKGEPVVVAQDEHPRETSPGGAGR